MPDNSLSKRFLMGNKFFSVFSEIDLDRFLLESNIKIYRKNNNLFLRGDEAETLYVILNGWVKLHRETPEGEDAIVALLNKGDVFNKSVLFGSKLHPVSAITLSDVSLAEIPINLVREVASANVNILKGLLALMANEINDLRMDNEHLSIMNAPQRVGCLILRLASKADDGSYETVMPYDKSLAAAKLGMKPETFSRALGQLREIGVVSRGSKIKIKDIEKLSSFCCRHCSSVVEDFGDRGLLCDGDLCCGRANQPNSCKFK